jgi:hypothetical protein
MEAVSSIRNPRKHHTAVTSDPPNVAKHQIIGYFKYVDGVLIIYDQRNTNIEETFNEHPHHKIHYRKEIALTPLTFSTFQYTAGKMS